MGLYPSDSQASVCQKMLNLLSGKQCHVTV